MSRKLSVIVPIYGVERYLDQCIGSICSQTYENLEIILVDDGSKDRSPDICDQWKQRDSRVKVIHKQNGGLVSARQAGLEEATGYYATYVDGDDWIDISMYENLMEEAERWNHAAELIAAGFCRCHKDGREELVYNNILPEFYQGDEYKKLFECMICQPPFYSVGIYPNVWSKIFIRERLIPVQRRVDQEISIGEDFAVTFPYMMEASNVLVLKNTGYRYRLNPGGMTGSRDKEYLKKGSHLIHYIEKNIYGRDKAIDRQLQLYIAHILINGINILLDIRTPLPFKEKKAMIKSTINADLVEQILKDLDYAMIGKLPEKTLQSVTNGHYLRAFLYVHLALLKSKIR